MNLGILGTYTVSNPTAINDFFLARLPSKLAMGSKNDLYKSYNGAFSGDMTLENMLKGVGNFIGLSPNPDENEKKSEGSGWGDYHYSQTEFGDTKYGSTTMAKGACGPVALANAFARLGIQVDPLTMAAISEAMGYAVDGGTSAGLFTNGARALGVNSSEISLDVIPKALRSGSQVILSGKTVGDHSHVNNFTQDI